MKFKRSIEEAWHNEGTACLSKKVAKQLCWCVSTCSRSRASIARAFTRRSRSSAVRCRTDSTSAASWSLDDDDEEWVHVGVENGDGDGRALICTSQRTAYYTECSYSIDQLTALARRILAGDEQVWRGDKTNSLMLMLMIYNLIKY